MKKVKVSKKPSVKEFTELKEAWYDLTERSVEAARYNIEMEDHLDRLRSVITRYEVFTISVVALVVVHIAWVIL